MLRPRKLVKSDHLLYVVTTGGEKGKVVNLRGGIAGDVNDAFGRSGKNVSDGFGMDALAGRIEKNNVGTVAKVGETGKLVEDIGSDKTDIGKMIALGSLPRFLDGFFHNLHADHALGARCGNLGKCTGAGIEVVDRFAT